MTEGVQPKEFVDLDWSGAVIREADLTGARMTGVLLSGADIDGVIDGLVVNGVEVKPLVEAELDRRHSERVALRPRDADGLRAAWPVVEAMWAPTMTRAALGDDAAFHPLALPASFISDGAAYCIDAGAQPTYDDVVAAREDRMSRVREFVAVCDADFVRPMSTGDRPGWPSAGDRTPLECLSVILNEEWARHQFAVRDLDLLGGSEVPR